MNSIPHALRSTHVLLVDTDSNHCSEVTDQLSQRQFHVSTVASATEAIQLTSNQRCDAAVLFCDELEPQVLDDLRHLQSAHASLQVIVVSTTTSITAAVEAMKAGACDFLTKPISPNALALAIQTAGTNRPRCTHTACSQPAVVREKKNKTSILGKSAAIDSVLQWIARVAPSEMPVLIEGESGTGKELVAREIHAASNVADQALVTINCAAVPASLLESELFGHEKGSFTGAIATKRGLFETADGGTLFIDEFGELAGDLQAKLLRVIEDGRLRRVGSTEERQVNVRLIAATNKTLIDEVRSGRFREDLFYRVNVLGARLPSLRERTEDIGLLAQHFLGEGWVLGDGVLELLQRYTWPGNVRQLSNVMERCKVLAGQPGIIAIDDLPSEIVDASDQQQLEIGGNVDLHTLNRSHVLKVLKQNRGNKAKSARVLGINRRSLYRLLEKYNAKHSA
ncbi:Transcriptional regulatory protein ZraR [Rosistilla oblonga]|uniref:Transcriptional regulatory protein ZraR n=1 Tax=Rosistilla oblonga TaxID=2527990 RepID=A0A518IWU6_9BACT|nr:sigma-54 dependent transcriptional regulator [Rosistilla oblonga]QDV14306.1 Transcriptional regulatory protein ZraR [Rosistilla oblonga]QDV57561.1 Transcriptional regulatory protein ZraR [Rosistilla oblonga]